MLNNADQFSLESALTITKVNENKNSEKVFFFFTESCYFIVINF